MVDQNSQFYAILTNVGAAKQANADALGIPWKITQMGLGDANGTDPTPNATQISLINERRRAPLNQLKVDDKDASIIVAEQVIPAEVGGYWIREIGLYDEAGDLVAVANCAPTYKPLLSQGSGRTQIVRMSLVVSNSSNVQLKIDPSVVLATRELVTEELARQDFKHSVQAATTAAITLSGLQTVDGVVLTAGARVLVKNQADAKTNGLYLVVASGAWTRCIDADSSAKVTPNLLVLVERGTANADSAWQLVTDAPITLGVTALAFEMAFGRTGVAAGTYRSVTVDKYGRVVAATSPTTIAGYGLTDAQPLNNNLTALANLATQGFYVSTAAGTVASRSVAVSGTGLAISNGNGVAGNPTISLSASGVAASSYTKVTVDALGRVTAGAALAAADIPNLSWNKITSDQPSTLGGYGITDAQPLNNNLTALANLVTQGLYVNSGVGTTVARSIAVSGTGLAVANGNGVAGNPTISLSVSGVAAGSYAKVTVDTLGRVTAGAALAAADIPNLSWNKITSDQPTTLGGYGITDAQPLNNNLTALANLATQGLYVNNGTGTAVARTIAVGTGLAVANGNGVAGNPTISLSVSGVAAGSYAKVTVDTLGRVTAGSAMVEADVPALSWSKITTGKPTTLGGYGITDAYTKAQVDALFTSKVPKATQDEVDTGDSDTAFVTPTKLRFGFNFIKGGGGANNAIVFPSWLGGLMIQWGVHVANGADAETTVTFPLAFSIIPALVSGFTHDGAVAQSGVVPQSRLLTSNGFMSRREDIASTTSFTGTAYIRWIAIGY